MSDTPTTAEPQPRFDPFTAEPQPRFDPFTGAPLGFHDPGDPPVEVTLDAIGPVHGPELPPADTDELIEHGDPRVLNGGTINAAGQWVGP